MEVYFKFYEMRQEKNALRDIGSVQWREILDRELLSAMKRAVREGKLSKESIM